MLTRAPNRSRALTATLAIAMSATVLAPAAHATDTEARTVVVAHSDLDLSTEEGREALDRRIDNAAEEACGFGETTLGTRARTREARDCYRQAKRQLERQFADVISAAQRGG
ncbi:UrcA family protein [Aurantiacibacter gilvus]|uniref:UrcA family protein n=1 Tax=Aurantiacibacter gilvus TaxID=3139141 RepID=A0ABU9IHA6_9SPHN